MMRIIDHIKTISFSNPLAEKIKKDIKYLQDQSVTKEKEYWHSLSMLSTEMRIAEYKSNCKKFLLEYKSAGEKDFVKDEIEINMNILGRLDKTVLVQKKSFFNISGYLNFLQNRLEDLGRERLQSDEKNVQLPFSLNRTETVVFWMLVKDSGLLGNISDYGLAKFLEANCLCENLKSLKSIVKEISQYRNHGKDPNHHLENIKHILSHTEIQINDVA